MCDGSLFQSVKTACMLFLAAAALMLPASAISPKRIESVQRRAAEGNKLIAFVVMKHYYKPDCPKCVNAVDAQNGRISRMIPNKGVVVIKIDQHAVKEGDVPAVVLKGMTPRLVITDATCTKVIDSINDKADKARVNEMESKIAAALGTKG